MLNNTKQQNDVLSQAYLALYSEYIVLKSSQLQDHQAEMAYSYPTMILGSNDRLDIDMFPHTDGSQVAAAGYLY